MVLWKRYLVLFFVLLWNKYLGVLPVVGFPLYEFNLRILAVKDLDICSACFSFETSCKLHMPRSLRAWIHRLNLLSEDLSQWLKETWKPALFFLPFRISSSRPVILLKLKNIRRNIYSLWPMFHISFRSHVSTVSLDLEVVSSVYPVENHWTVVRLRLDLPPGASLVPSNHCVFTQSQLLQYRSQVLFTVVRRPGNKVEVVPYL